MTKEELNRLFNYVATKNGTNVIAIQRNYKRVPVVNAKCELAYLLYTAHDFTPQTIQNLLRYSQSGFRTAVVRHARKNNLPYPFSNLDIVFVEGVYNDIKNAASKEDALDVLRMFRAKMFAKGYKTGRRDKIRARNTVSLVSYQNCPVLP